MTHEPQPVQPIDVEYFNAAATRARTDPLWRAARTLAIFGVILGAYGAVAPLFGTRGIFTFTRLVTSSTSMYYGRTQWSIGFVIAEWFLSAVLVVASVGCLWRHPSGRRGMIVFAFA